jgi:hypothetical protein
MPSWKVLFGLKSSFQKGFRGKWKLLLTHNLPQVLFLFAPTSLPAVSNKNQQEGLSFKNIFPLKQTLDRLSNIL